MTTIHTNGSKFSGQDPARLIRNNQRTLGYLAAKAGAK